MISPVILVLGEPELTMVAVLGPLTCVHTPVPTTAVFAFNVVDVARQRSISVPAFEVVGPEEILIVTFDELVQPALLMVHVNIYVPGTSPVMVVVGDVGLVIVAAEPDDCVQVPVPITAVFAAIVTVVPHFVCVGPALAMVTSFTSSNWETLVVPHSFVTSSEIV